jgi:hypothetical protein
VTLWVVDDVGDTVALNFGEFSGSKLGIDSQDLAHEESEPSSDSLNFIKSIRNGSLTIDVGVENTMNMLEVSIWVFNNE